MAKRKLPLLNNRSVAIHLVILASIIIAFTMTINSLESIKESLKIISYIVVGLISLFLIFELIFVSLNKYKKKRKTVDSVKECFIDQDIRELVLSPYGILASLLFALAHYLVFVQLDIWYFGLLASFYLFGIAIKSYHLHLLEFRSHHKFLIRLTLSSIFMMILSLLFIATIVTTNLLKDRLHEPTILFILDIVFFVGKLFFLILNTINAIKHKEILMISYSISMLLLTFFTLYAIYISILHMNEHLETTYIFIGGFILSGICFIFSLIMFIRNIKEIRS